MGAMRVVRFSLVLEVKILLCAVSMRKKPLLYHQKTKTPGHPPRGFNFCVNYTARVTLPDLRQLVQILMVLAWPLSLILIFFTFVFQNLLALLETWLLVILILCPVCLVLSHNSHLAMWLHLPLATIWRNSSSYAANIWYYSRKIMDLQGKLF